MISFNFSNLNLRISLKLNIKIKCAYFEIEINTVENNYASLFFNWNASKQTFI